MFIYKTKFNFWIIKTKKITTISLMNSSGELHPNWLALTTLPLQLKRFVRAGDPDSVPESPKAVKHQINGLNGAEAQEFYKEVLDADDSPPLASLLGFHSSSLAEKPSDTESSSSSDIFPFLRAVLHLCIDACHLVLIFTAQFFGTRVTQEYPLGAHLLSSFGPALG